MSVVHFASTGRGLKQTTFLPSQFMDAHTSASVAAEEILKSLSRTTADVHDEELKELNLQLLKEVQAYKGGPLLTSARGALEVAAVFEAVKGICDSKEASEDYVSLIKSRAKVPFSSSTVSSNDEVKLSRERLDRGVHNAATILKTNKHYEKAEVNAALGVAGGGGAGGAGSAGGDDDDDDGAVGVIAAGTNDLTCPIMKVMMQEPVRNKGCNHVYDKKGIDSLRRPGKPWNCPICKQPITTLVPDERTKALVKAEMERLEREGPDEDEDEEDDYDDYGDGEGPAR